tara:strand:+ start:928 stop:1599 length:672 start_codon:yes stop_codon:yes gene_type:complete
MTERVPALFVPGDCKTLEEAAERVKQDPRITTIVLGKGEHQLKHFFFYISSAMTIVGRPDVPKEDIVVVGGIWIMEGIQGNCHLQHLTLRQSYWSGVVGASSFTMNDVLVEQCRCHGVSASGTGVVGRCTNVEVRQCGLSGMVAYDGASITLIGPKTTVHHNCTRGDSTEYGLKVGGSFSAIQLVPPLTEQQASTDNSGGGNWGVETDGDFTVHQTKTIALRL